MTESTLKELPQHREEVEGVRGISKERTRIIKFSERCDGVVKAVQESNMVLRICH